jgi:hypothetical protein
VNFDSNHASVEKNMDDLILKAVIWQDDHWVETDGGQKILWMLMTRETIIFWKGEDNENDTEEVKTLRVSYFLLEEWGSSFVSITGS